jgi:hypothetical protein
MSQLARDWGKRKERALFDRFGGRPTEMMLSHVHARNRNVLLARHDKLRRLRPDLRVPTEVEEARDPYAAFKVYEACTGHLISATRNKETFPLVFEENCNYGFRRNLWGMKALGISLAVGALVIVGGRLYLQFSTHIAVAPFDIGIAGLIVVFLSVWLLRVTPSWVMIPAREYPNRLMEYLDTHE